jgi:carbamoyltransferase
MSKRTIILGISCFYHDAAAALIVDGEIIAASQEERFTRIKHDSRFPVNAINYCLEEAGVRNNEIDAIAFYDNPVLSLDRILNSVIMGYPESKGQWMENSPGLLGYKLFLNEAIFEFFKIKIPIFYSEHHFSHAASAFYPSPFDESAILTIDGVGEWSTTTIGYGSKNNIDILSEIHYPHSLGLLYSAVTFYCGFKVNSGEYKLMGLAPYGEPVYKDLIYDNLINVKEDGSYHLNMKYFGFVQTNSMINDQFCELFGAPARKPETRISKKEMDIAASIQLVTEEIVLKLAKEAKRITNSENLVMAGGVALNCVANGKILNNNIFKNIWVQPASGDAGCSLGAALQVYYSYFKKPRVKSFGLRDSQKGSLLGISFSDREIESFLNTYSIPAKKVSQDDRAKSIANLIASQKILGYFSGRMEFGPRSLGARSIIGDPRDPKMQSDMNLKIKYRESFRPFAPVVLREKVFEYFDLNQDSPYMLLVAPVREDIRLKSENIEPTENLIEIVNIPRSSIPSVTHVDYSARVQTVDGVENPKFYDIIKEFYKITGCAVLINTSFNVRGEPIVCSPKDAYKCFMRTNMDVLILEDYILYKEDQPEFNENKNWQNEYELD